MNADPLLIIAPIVFIGTCFAMLSSKPWVRVAVVIPVLILSVILSFGIGQTYERIKTQSTVSVLHNRFYTHLRELAENKQTDVLAESVIDFSQFYSSNMHDPQAVANKMAAIESRNVDTKN
jgi:hypothetical protein